MAPARQSNTQRVDFVLLVLSLTSWLNVFSDSAFFPPAPEARVGETGHVALFISSSTDVGLRKSPLRQLHAHVGCCGGGARCLHSLDDQLAREFVRQ